jgi:hypothetical protein
VTAVTVRLRDGFAWMLLGVSSAGDDVSEIVPETTIVTVGLLKPASPSGGQGKSSSTIRWSLDISSSSVLQLMAASLLTPEGEDAPVSVDTQALSRRSTVSAIVDAMHPVDNRATAAPPACGPPRATGEAWTVRPGWPKTF